MLTIQNCIHLSSSLGVLENMPILVQWKWKERTKSYLVIFHFYDDYSKTNLRLKKRKFIATTGWRPLFYFPVDREVSQRLEHETMEDKDREFEKPVITWAPSHLESDIWAKFLDMLT